MAHASQKPHQFELEDAINKYVNNVITYIKIPHTQAEIAIAQRQDEILGPLVAYLKYGKMPGIQHQVKCSPYFDPLPLEQCDDYC